MKLQLEHKIKDCFGSIWLLNTACLLKKSTSCHALLVKSSNEVKKYSGTSHRKIRTPHKTGQIFESQGCSYYRQVLLLNSQNGSRLPTLLQQFDDLCVMGKINEYTHEQPYI